MCAARFLTSRAKDRASARWWRKSQGCAEAAQASAHELAAVNLDGLCAAVLKFQRHLDVVGADEAACRDAEAGVPLARDLHLRHDGGRVELVGHGVDAALQAFRRLDPKLEMIERPRAF